MRAQIVRVEIVERIRWRGHELGHFVVESLFIAIVRELSTRLVKQSLELERHESVAFLERVVVLVVIVVHQIEHGGGRDFVIERRGRPRYLIRAAYIEMRDGLWRVLLVLYSKSNTKNKTTIR